MSTESANDNVNAMRRLLVRWAIVLVITGLFFLWAAWRMANVASRPARAAAPGAAAGTAEPAIEYWTCTMHPEVRQPSPGQCPQCGMDLVPKYAGSDVPGAKPTTPAAAPAPAADPAGRPEAWYRCTMPECGDVGSAVEGSRCPVCGMVRERVDDGGGAAGEYEIRLTERARRLAAVETAPVKPRRLFRRIRTVGKLGYDETRYKMVSAWVGGRIDKLFADFTGMSVTRGDHLVELYSPDLLSAQEEYLQAMRARGAVRDGSEIARRNADQLLRSARRKLELLGITGTQIDTIERAGEPQIRLVIHAPIGGTIVQKSAMEGMYVKTGDVLYTIADLSHLWILVELYEADLPWIHPFQDVTVTTTSLPGEVFTGVIVFVDPRVDPKTRTVDIRIHVDNPALRLKPDMWVTAEITAALARGGRGAVPAPEGPYACPMHPWETAAAAQDCPICAMPMTRVEDLPQYTPPTDPVPLLAVPRSAVMQTGDRALVYREAEPGLYRGVEVTVGPLAQDEQGTQYYPILTGLNGDERVVTRGNFAIDSAMTLAGKPSLFTARGLGAGTSHDHAAAATDAPASGDPATHVDTQGARDAGAIVQTICPVMGNPIDPQVYVEYQGVKVYFCCWGCDDKFLAEPEKYLPKLPESIQARIRGTPQSRPAEGDPRPPDPLPAGRGSESPSAASAAPTGQTADPVSGEPIDPQIWIRHFGVPVYFAEPVRIGQFLTNPLQYVGELPADVRRQIGRAELEGVAADADPGPWRQTRCPVMGNPIHPQSFVDFHGVRVFFCCPGCDTKFVADPRAYLDKLPPKIAGVIRDALAKEGPARD